MTPSRLTPVVLAVPGVALGIAGLFHPHALVPDTADQWFVLHVVGLVFFPLVGLALAALVRGRQDPLAWVVRLGAFGFAVFYTALDVVYGVAAGSVTRDMGEGYRRSADFSEMLQVSVRLGEVGSWSLIVGVVAVAVDQVRRRGVGGLPALLLLPGAWLVHTDHIFSPGGVVGMLLIGVATGLLAAELPATRRGPLATDRVASAS